MQQVLPDKNDIYEMLNLLLGDNMSVEYVDAISSFDDTYVALYVDAEDTPRAVCICDLEFAGYSGGAMTMMPVGGVQDAIGEKDLSGTLEQNLYEVMNICTRLVINDETPHLRLTEVKKSSEVTEIIETLLGTGNRGDYEVSIPRYGKGHMTFLVA